MTARLDAALQAFVATDAFKAITHYAKTLKTREPNGVIDATAIGVARFLSGACQFVTSPLFLFSDKYRAQTGRHLRDGVTEMVRGSKLAAPAAAVAAVAYVALSYRSR